MRLYTGAAPALRIPMDNANTILLIGGLLLFLCTIASALSTRFGVPLLLGFLAIGMLAGEDGIGRIQFSDYDTAFLVGNLALAIILLDGGLRTKMRTFRVALWPAITLATFGVVATAVLLGIFASWLLTFDWRYGLLLGAIVSSTDAAAVFSILRHGGVDLNERVGAVLEIESGVNDPMAAFLVIALIELILAAAHGGATAGGSALAFATKFAIQLGLGAGGGYVLGKLFARLLEKVRLAEGLYGVLIASGGLLSFAAINYLGGSGFLAIYLIGVFVGNRNSRGIEHVFPVMDGLAWLSQAGMFLLLGMLVTPSDLINEGWPGILIALFLMCVARPAAVFASLLPFKVPLRETAYVAWVGLRGAVPIVLALFPLLHGMKHSGTMFNIAFIVVLTSLLIQGYTVPIAARLLRVQVPRRQEPIDRKNLRAGGRVNVDLLLYRVEKFSPVAGKPGSVLETIDGVRGAGVIRGTEFVFPDAAFRFAEGDRVYVVVPETVEERVAKLFSPRLREGRFASHIFLGDLALEGDALLGAVAETYGIPVSPGDAQLTLDQFIHRRLYRRPVFGDAVAFGPLAFTVREIEGRKVAKVGLRLRR